MSRALETAMNDAQHCAPVVERMIDLLCEEKNRNMTFGEALTAAQLQLGIVVPKHMEAPVLAIAAKIIIGRRVPGAPDA